MYLVWDREGAKGRAVISEGGMNKVMVYLLSYYKVTKMAEKV